MFVQKVSGLGSEYKKTSFQGKFVKLSKFTPMEQADIDRFIKFSWKNITNEALIKKKPYDIFVLRNKKGDVELRTFMERGNVEPLDCYIETLRYGKNQDEINTRNFRNSIEWYENYKKEHYGYNGIWERIKLFFR